MTRTHRPHRRPVAVLQPRLPADFRAFHELYRSRYVYWAQLYLSSWADAEEAVDIAFEQLYFNWSKVLSKANPRAYAWRVVRHRTIDLARARGRRAVAVDTAAFETTRLEQACDPIGELEISLEIYQAVQDLPERQHDVFILHHVLGYTARETADVLGITEGGVRSTARYARHRLNKALGTDRNPGGRDDRAEGGRG
ncbi:RNA polymerase sigma factor [Streptomyces aureoversilis]|uniref:RNA polymerase sigma factor n=1 Tax=Streptomyces aureoversilis TaxID=67277 RepID=A0ABW0A818_9ACTN